MNRTETLEEFYKTKLNWVPDTIRKEIGHFNVFKLDDFVGCHSKPIPYSRKDYYKISLIIGRNKVHYADKVVEIQKQALLFANPQIPYNWEQVDAQQSGFFCVFTPAFFHHFGNLNSYTMFQPNGTPVFELTDEQAAKIKAVFERMFEEIDSSYTHKYDALRLLVLEILHQTARMQPAQQAEKQHTDAAHRISVLFLELLERQFPIEDTRQRVALRSASDFADQLSIHVNHLSRAVRKTTQKTTTDLIGERLLQEAKILLKHTDWNVSEIAFALGFTEVTHFNNFFKKKLQLNPTQFRNVSIS
ncbi:helix-turn-helix domain-containing protein [Pontibacter silvestris]|uniref:Helix-turn-helix domain-containing protein n=1 Tax=Pontibacter silvestris TaxID=2305183 RepID=A0ABW4WUB1_9BACT|nr:helix-turn-helix transcriptional regulator [Pontibacter silvestris]MCC9136995.1 helix-turn-helix transcriptional regulator [Pontibacter silvestris]